MTRDQFINLKQDIANEQYKEGVLFQETIEHVYEDIDYKMKLPDRLGKTVRVTDKQFPRVNVLLEEASKELGLRKPEMFVYENYYYGAESYGIDKPWIEISAKTIQDFSEKELIFVIAREIFQISDGVTKQKTMLEERLKTMKSVAPTQVEQISKLSFYRWYRLANYSADNFGYLMCGSVSAAVNAIMLTVLNSRLLVQQTDLNEFINQASEINKLDDEVYNYTKADELVPYAPFRIQNLLAFAESDRGINGKR